MWVGLELIRAAHSVSIISPLSTTTPRLGHNFLHVRPILTKNTPNDISKAEMHLSMRRRGWKYKIKLHSGARDRTTSTAIQFVQLNISELIQIRRVILDYPALFMKTVLS